MQNTSQITGFGAILKRRSGVDVFIVMTHPFWKPTRTYLCSHGSRRDLSDRMLHGTTCRTRYFKDRDSRSLHVVLAASKTGTAGRNCASQRMRVRAVGATDDLHGVGDGGRAGERLEHLDCARGGLREERVLERQRLAGFGTQEGREGEGEEGSTQSRYSTRGQGGQHHRRAHAL